MAFKDYKSRRKDDLEEIKKQVAAVSEKTTYEKDPDDWYPSTDKAGNGLAVVRLLPALETEDQISWVRWYSYAFKNPENNRWYIENSLTTFGFDHADPMAEFNSKLWNMSDDKNSPSRKQATRQARKFNLRVRVLVVSDSGNPSNNGKIKKWLMGKTFWKFIDSALNPPVIEGAIEQIEPINPFDLLEGANLKILIGSKIVDGKPTRDYKLSWQQSGPVFKTEDRIVKLYDEYNAESDRWSLLKYIAPDKFKSYDELKKKMIWTFGYDPLGGKPATVNPATGEEATPKSNKPKTFSEKPPKEENECPPPEKFDFAKLEQEDEDEIVWK